MNKSIKICLTMILVITLSSCGIYKKYQLPDTELAQDFKKSQEQQIDTTSLPALGWEKVFTDPILQNLIRTALNNNRDLDNARLNVDIAQAQLKGAKLSYLPSLSISPNGGTSYMQSAPSNWNWTYTLPAAVNWEIDVFGKILNAKRAAQAGKEMAQDYEQATRSQVICGVASCYYSIVMLNQQLDLLQRTATTWKEQVESMQLMKQAARVNEAAVVQSRANYYSILATIPDVQQQIALTQNSLSLLLNTYPQQWDVTDNLEFDIPQEAINGIPLVYLANRPDVRAAERNLAQAYYAKSKARANFYPSLSVSANGGFTNLLGSMISNPGKWFMQLAGSLTAPIFSRGQNIATLEAAKAQQQQALNKFEYSVLSASADLSNVMVKLNTADEKRGYLLEQIDQLQKSVDYTQELLTSGRATYLEVLTAQTSLLSAETSSLQNWYTKVSALISLYQTVGGGQ